MQVNGTDNLMST